MKRVDESRAIRRALEPDTLADYAGSCHVASLRLVESFDTEGSALSTMWRSARVARGRCSAVPLGHSWVVVDGSRIVDITRWYYDRDADPIYRTSIDDPAYQETIPAWTESELRAAHGDR